MTSRFVSSNPIAGAGSETGPRVVTALFPSQSEAERAVRQLMDEGVPKDAIRLLPGNERDRPDGASGTRGIDPALGSGFVAALGEFFLSENSRTLYTEGLNQGGCLVSVHATQANHDRILDLLGRDGTIDTDEPDVG